MLQPTAELHLTRANDDSDRHFDLLRDQAAAPDLSRDEVVALESALPGACGLEGIDSRIRLNFFVIFQRTHRRSLPDPAHVLDRTLSRQKELTEQPNKVRVVHCTTQNHFCQRQAHSCLQTVTARPENLAQ